MCALATAKLSAFSARNDDGDSPLDLLARASPDSALVADFAASGAPIAMLLDADVEAFDFSMLLARGWDPDQAYGLQSHTQLHLACRLGNQRCARMLLLGGASSDISSVSASAFLFAFLFRFVLFCLVWLVWFGLVGCLLFVWISLV